MAEDPAKKEFQIQRQRQALCRRMGADGEILKGSLIERYTVCRQPSCHCLKGQKHGPYLYVSVFDGKQSRQVYVPQAMEAQVRRWVKNGHILAASIATLSDLGVQLIRLRHSRKNATAVNPKPRRKP